jgi:hypothetical protein
VMWWRLGLGLGLGWWRIWRTSAAGLVGDVPCMRNDDVVEWGVLLAEAGEAYPQDHCVLCLGVERVGVMAVVVRWNF